MNAMFFGMPNALFPAFGDVFGARNVGWLYAAGPAGALVLSLTSGWALRIRRHGLAIAWAAGYGAWQLSASACPSTFGWPCSFLHWPELRTWSAASSA